MADDAAFLTENHPEALTWAESGRTISQQPSDLVSINHLTVAMPHTQFSHGLKLERAENCGRSSILLPHPGGWVPRKVSTCRHFAAALIAFLISRSIVSDQSEGCQNSKLWWLLPNQPPLFAKVESENILTDRSESVPQAHQVKVPPNTHSRAFFKCYVRNDSLPLGQYILVKIF